MDLQAPGPADSVFARLTLALTLSAVAGFVDAVGYLQLGHLFVSFMSGNTTRFAIAVANADLTLIVPAGAVIFTFVFGAFVGAWVGDSAGRYSLPAVLAVEIMLIGAALGMVHAAVGFASILPIVAAMGMQNNARQVVANADIGKTFVTGTLFGIGQSLALAIRGKAPPGEWLAFAAAGIAFVGGATVGALAFAVFGLTAALAFVMIVLAAAVLATLPPRRVA